MLLPTNGITPEVIRASMPPYRLNPDLLAATIAALPPPPPEATQAWRHAHLTRLIDEILARRPADADQARDTAGLLIVRELADTCAADAHAADITVEQRCRLARTAADLLRSATALQRTLARNQQKPVPFFGTVVQDDVDLAVLDAVWRNSSPGKTPTQREAARPEPARTATPTPPPPSEPPPPEPPPPEPPPPEPTPPEPPPGLTLPAAAPTQTAQQNAAPPPTVTALPQPDRASTPKTRPASSDPATQWTITQLDSGLGWTREILRHRDAPDPAR